MRYPSENQPLAHYGIRGQKHGVRRFQNEDGTLTEEGKIRYGYYDRKDGTKDYKRLQKDAARDAKEFARAKAYYGEGAGIRRKQIKNLISERMKDADYKKEFERLLGTQNMSAHQKAANRERKFEDTKHSVKRTANGIKNMALGFGSVSLTALALYSAAKMTGADKLIGSFAKRTVSNVVRMARHTGRAAHYGKNAASAFAAYMGGR